MIFDVMIVVVWLIGWWIFFNIFVLVFEFGFVIVGIVLFIDVCNVVL